MTYIVKERQTGRQTEGQIDKKLYKVAVILEIKLNYLPVWLQPRCISAGLEPDTDVQLFLKILKNYIFFF